MVRRDNPQSAAQGRSPEDDASGAAGTRRPAYRRVADEIRSSVESGLYSGDTPLPTEAEIGERFRVSRQTIRRAFRELVSEGLVYRVAGRGTFVTRSPGHGRYLRSVGTIEDLEAWPGSEMEVISPIQLIQNLQVSARLELDSSVVATLKLLRLNEGVPFGMTRVFLSPELGSALTDTGFSEERRSGTVIGTLSQLGLTDVLEAEQVITAVSMTREIADLIDAPYEEPSLQVERTYFDTRGRPVEVAVTCYNPERYDHRIRIRRHPSK